MQKLSPHCHHMCSYIWLRSVEVTKLDVLFYLDLLLNVGLTLLCLHRALLYVVLDPLVPLICQVLDGFAEFRKKIKNILRVRLVE
jgi:hypothetical protein